MNNTYDDEKLKKANDLKNLKDVIAKELSKGPKTEDDLKKALPNVSYAEILNALKFLLQLRLITKKGYPVVYSLSDEIKNKLKKREELRESDVNLLKTAIIIESKSDDKAKLSNFMKTLFKNLKEDKAYKIYDASLEEIIVHDGLFSTFITAELSCSDLHSLFRLIYYYGATNVEILEPTKITVGLADLQRSAMLISDMIHGYADMIFKLKKENEELAKLRK